MVNMQKDNDRKYIGFITGENDLECDWRIFMATNLKVKFKWKKKSVYYKNELVNG